MADEQVFSVRADVYKAGVLAAGLGRTPSGTHFQYLADYLASGRVPVASTLPLTAVPTVLPAGAVPPYFAGLLPEGRRLTTLRRAIKASADDELALLLAVGADTVGDVQVVPHGEKLSEPAPLLEIPNDLSDFSFATALNERGIVDRIGIPGVQDKVSGRMISLPARASTSDLIVKLSPPEFEFVVENEAFFLNVARQAGLRTPDWRLVQDSQGVTALLVERFDRVGAGPPKKRLAFEDAAQALGLWPADKYNVTLEEVGQRLMRLTAAPSVAALELFRQVAFAMLIGNGDQHAKNLAVLATETGEWRISPAYDLISTLPYGDNTLALTLDGSSSPFSRRKLLNYAALLGLTQKLAEKALDEMLRRTEPLLSNLTLPYSQNVLREMRKTLAYRRRQLTA